jgi:hypothetical protein
VFELRDPMFEPPIAVLLSRNTQFEPLIVLLRGSEQWIYAAFYWIRPHEHCHQEFFQV